MPCACKVPVATYPETADWGPLFWTLLHGLAERSGKQTNEILQGDERRAWIQVIQNLAATLPCEQCRLHFSDYVLTHPVKSWLNLPYVEFGRTVRTWIWAVHNEVNQRLGKSTFPFENLTETYREVKIREIWQRLDPVIQRAILLSGINLFAWRKWTGNIRSIEGVYGI